MLLELEGSLELQWYCALGLVDSSTPSAGVVRTVHELGVQRNIEAAPFATQ